VWLVEHGDGQRLIVKAARDGSQLGSGLIVAQEVEKRGIPSGVAQPAVGGTLTVPVDGREVAVLAYVPGRPLDPSSQQDAELWGTTLGRLHRVLVGVEAPEGTDRWPWSWPDADHDCLAELPDVRAAVKEAVSEARRAATRDVLTLGMLHSDPGPTNFRVDGAGAVGVIDWDQATWGPLLYDVAAMLAFHEWLDGNMHSDTILDHYRSASPVAAQELELVDVFVRLRWAVSAWWFAWRIAQDDLLGMNSPADNHDGLAAAMARLTIPQT
jgi:Ser/Thr protein kinase RdoA (MazF antagonist)